MRLAPAIVLSQLWVCMAAAATDVPDRAEALAWLQTIANAAAQLNYCGTFVYQHGDDQAETCRILHLVDHGAEYEKLETLDGPKREIIRTPTEILTYLADTQLVKREKRTTRKLFPAILPEQLSGVAEHYQLRKGRAERIAGYDAHAVILEPRDEYRYGHKFWVEDSTGLLLKARMLDEKNHAVEQFQFTQLDINCPLTRDSVKPSFTVPSDGDARSGIPPSRGTAKLGLTESRVSGPLMLS